MPRYKVLSYGGIDGTTFPDLLIHYSTGYLLPLHVKQGEYVPLEILDPLDVKKSLIVGSLGRYIASGDILIEDDKIQEKLDSMKNSNIESIPEVQTSTTPTSTIETKSVPELKPQEAQLEEHLTNLSDVKNIDDFFKLSYFLKLRFIKECTDKDFLNQIINRTDSKQLKNNVALRIASF